MVYSFVDNYLADISSHKNRKVVSYWFSDACWLFKLSISLVISKFTQTGKRILGSGKSSAVSIVKNVLTKHHIPFAQTREPGGTPLAEQLRNIVKSINHSEQLTQETELLLMYASRSQLVANVILPALAKGEWVIGDRHDMSSRAYQGGGRNIADDVLDNIANVTLKGFKPDLTLYLDISPELGLSRAKARGALDRIELEQIDFFDRVHKKYQSLAALDDTIITIDASQPMDIVHQHIEKALDRFIKTTMKIND